ncbi:polygalacturonase inhibitor-like [Iris pallida]|uniref:Polygalacturonase inhibitor-like n=1 Tax=Iris pallida TaxID=29817 RepID=A0AAX6GUF2_IRIPA|nr:polygalacturonase inhibitor-like [Iris pallida]KAJ6832374.1 polygalacturonase inhibitor-like [Iris pallida]KAJ6832375.1 polygalacturonase inhibitor-like [Iris pallida]KAJ6832376.1 polygalacturonase inhibitor-like [Iris pallida]KAJ6832377.1 polygalacturonase inhibitor-like [Iris pallida]
MASDVLTLLSITLLFFLAAIPLSSAACTKEDVKALLAFKNSFPPNTFPNSWGDTSTSCCFWEGVDCTYGRVTSLFFTSDEYTNDVIPVNLKGTLPPSVGDLSALTGISISSQADLVGPIPSTWSKLIKLEYFTIYNSSISGPVPSFLSHFKSLQQLTINDCKLTGTIPPSLGDLANLRSIALAGNMLTGTIPSTLFSKLKKGLLADLELSENRLTGAIPKSFGSVAFRNVNLQDNKLTGDASFLFGKSKPAFQILLARNNLSFDLTNVEYSVKYLETLDLSHNEIYGSINEQITEASLDLSQNGSFDVSYNKLCGKIPRGGKFTPTEPDYFTHNKCLCGKPLPPCK